MANNGSRPMGPSLLSPTPPKTEGARVGMGAMAPTFGGSIEGGERSFKHAMKGDTVHDAHIKDGAGGKTHLNHAVGHLEAMKSRRPDKMIGGGRIKR